MDNLVLKAIFFLLLFFVKENAFEVGRLFRRL